MKTNFTQAKSWIISAITDINRVVGSLERNDFADVAFRSQFAIEKLIKALLSLMGVKVEKTHIPTKVLKDLLKNEGILTIDEETEKKFNKVIKFSGFFEEQGTKTRYGTIKNEILTLPEDIYNSFEDIKEFIFNMVNLIHEYLIILEEIFGITKDKFEDLQHLKNLLGKLKKWI